MLLPVAIGLEPRVVAGTPLAAAELHDDAIDGVKAEGAVAGRARVGRLARGVAGHEWFDDRGAEVLAQVEHEVRHALGVAQIARGPHGARGAAGALGVRRRRVDPESQR